VRQMAERLEALGYPDYRRADAAVLRLLRDRGRSIGELGQALGVTRQAARHVVDGLEARLLATTGRDERDSRRVLVVLTPSGRAYARDVTDVVHALNHELSVRVDAAQLAAARAVLDAVIHRLAP
jgi:DNA-binding MarR family transcriptional regulator